MSYRPKAYQGLYTLKYLPNTNTQGEATKALEAELEAQIDKLRDKLSPEEQEEYKEVYWFNSRIESV